MAFFDPPHEKIIGWSPAYFQAPARAIVPSLDVVLGELGVPSSGLKLFRTAVIGRLALLAASDDPGSCASFCFAQALNIFTARSM